jgi:sensor domain CHASE-containing protein
MNAAPLFRLDRQTLARAAPIAALTVVFAAVAAWLVFDADARQRDAASQAQRHLISSVFEARASALRDMVVDYAIWDDAYEATERWDTAWLNANFYSSIFDGVIVFRNGQMRYLWVADGVVDGRGALARDAMQSVRAMPDLELLSTRPRYADASASTLMAYRGRLAFVAVAPITLEDDDARIERAMRDEPHDYFMGVRLLDEPSIAEIGRLLGVDDLRFEPQPAPESSRAILPVSDIAPMAPGALTWRTPQPTDAPFERLAWIIAGLLAAACLALWAAGLVRTGSD